MRPVLAARGVDQAPRALANLDLLLERARAFSARGLTQLARELDSDWDETAPHAEARGEPGGEAIEIVTVHSSKGLERPVVIPINSVSEFYRPETFVYRRRDDTLHWVLGDVAPPAIADAISVDKKESAEQGERLLYVACTRAIDLLILPQLPTAKDNTWARLVDLKQVDLPELKLSDRARGRAVPAEKEPNQQTPAVFADEQAVVVRMSAPVSWIRPSDADPDRQPLDATIQAEVEQLDIPEPVVVGSTARGLILHKLMEELLTGELPEAADAVRSRADVLLDELGLAAGEIRPDAMEIAATVLKTLALAPIAERRGTLLPEIDIYASRDEGWTLIGGRADAVSYEDGHASVVFDWKSDVQPSDADRRAHRAQVREYARALGAARGAVVYMSLGEIQWFYF